MKRSATVVAVIVLALLFLSTQAFQCSSPDITSGKLYFQQYEQSKDTTRLNLALESFEREVKTRPNSAEGWYWAGLIYGVKKDYMRLNDAWKSSLAASSQMKGEIEKNRVYFWSKAYNDGVATLQKARAIGKMQYYQDALSHFKAAITLEPDSSAKYGAYVSYAACLWDMKKYDDAVEPLKEAIKREKSEEAYRILGNYYLNRGNDRKKVFQEKNADALATTSTLGKLRKGLPAKEVTELIGEPASKKSTGKKSEEWSFAKGYFVKLEEGKIVSASFTPGTEPRIDSTEMKLAMKEYDESMRILNDGNKVHPKSDNLHAALIGVYIEANRATEAIDLFKQDVTKNPNDKVAHYNYGVVLLGAKMHDEAIEQFAAAIAIDAKYENALYNISRAYVNQGVELREQAARDNPDPMQQSKEYLKKFEAALPHIEKYLELKPTDIDSWELAGRIYTSTGKSDKASAAFEKADKLRQGKK